MLRSMQWFHLSDPANKRCFSPSIEVVEALIAEMLASTYMVPAWSVTILAHFSDAWTKQKGEEFIRSHDLRSHFLMRPALGGVEVGLPGGALRLRGAADCSEEEASMSKLPRGENTPIWGGNRLILAVTSCRESNLNKCFESCWFGPHITPISQWGEVSSSSP